MDVDGAHIAGFWRRVFAAVADGIIIAVPALAIGNLFFDQLAALGQNGRWRYPISLLYFGLLNSRLGNGQTLGKRLFGIRVAGASGNPIGPARSLLRASVLSLPWFVNGVDLAPFVPPAVPNGAAVAAAAASLAIFGVGLASVYLYIFNRGTRQALHDLLVESFVVRAAEPQGEVRPRVSPVHFAIAVAILGGALVLPLVAMPAAERVGQTEPFSRLSRLQEAVADDPDVAYVLATSEWQVFSSVQSGTSKTDYLTITVRLKKRHKDVQPIIERVARKVLQLEPKLLGQDKLRIVISTGFDIGIAQYEDKQADEGTPAEWLEKLGPLPQTI